MKRFIRNISFAIIMVIVLLGFGTLYFHKYENWSYVNSFYFSVMTLTTIGYGDFVPTKDVTKIVTSIYAIFGIGIMFYLLSSVVGEYWLRQKKRIDKIFGSIKNSIPRYVKTRVKKEVKNKLK